MNQAALLLCLCAFALMAALPFTFFRPGRMSGGWWLTATPFFADAALVTAALAGAAAPLSVGATTVRVLTLTAVPLIAAALTLIGCTIGVHRANVSMWHQENDGPDVLVTNGPYARIRHPFYASFLLILTGTAAALPHPVTLALLCAGTIQLHRTARREESRLLASPLGPEYASYMARTGRFLPAPRAVSRRGAATGSRGSRAGSRSPVAIPPSVRR